MFRLQFLQLQSMMTWVLLVVPSLTDLGEASVSPRGHDKVALGDPRGLNNIDHAGPTRRRFTSQRRIVKAEGSVEGGGFNTSCHGSGCWCREKETQWIPMAPKVIRGLTAVVGRPEIRGVNTLLCPVVPSEMEWRLGVVCTCMLHVLPQLIPHPKEQAAHRAHRNGAGSKSVAQAEL